MGKGKGIKHRLHSVELTLAAVARMRAGECVSALARELGVRRKSLYQWKAAVESGYGFPGSAHKRVDTVVGATEAYAARESAERIKDLEALVGRLSAENRFFRGALQSIEELRQRKSASSSAASSPQIEALTAGQGDLRVTEMCALPNSTKKSPKDPQRDPKRPRTAFSLRSSAGR